MKAVRFVGPDGRDPDRSAGRGRDNHGWRRGRPGGFRSHGAGVGFVARSRRPDLLRRRGKAAPSGGAREADRDRAQLPHARGRVAARHPGRAGGLREVRLVPDRAGRGDRYPARGDAPRLRGRGRRGDRPASTGPTATRRGPRSAASAAINDVSGRRAQLETPLRQFTLGKSFDTFSPLGPCIASMDGSSSRHRPAHDGLGRAHAGRKHERFDLLDRRADRVHLEGSDALPRRCHRHRDPGRGRRLA